MKIIDTITETWKEEGLRYVITQAPNHVMWETTQLSPFFTIERDELVSLCEDSDENRIQCYTSSDTFQINRPLREDVADEFLDLVGTYKCNPNFMYELHEIRLTGPRAIPQTQSGRIVLEPFGTESLLQNKIYETFKNIGYFKTIQLLLEGVFPTGPDHEIDEAVYLVARHGPNYDTPNYGHWINENLPQLQAVRKYKKQTNKDPVLLINSDPPSWLTDLLKLMGFAEEDWVEWNHTSATVNTLLLPELDYIHSFRVRPNPVGKRWARGRILKNTGNVDSSTYPEEIFMSRQGADRRKIQNFGEVKSVLNEFEFGVYCPEELSTKEEIGLFRQADTILGVAGSNIAGIIYSRDSNLIEILPHDEFMPVYFTLANELELDYAYVMGEEPDGETESDQHQNIVIDTNELATVLEEVCGFD